MTTRHIAEPRQPKTRILAADTGPRPWVAALVVGGLFIAAGVLAVLS